jgi:hypothetical protein
MNFNPNIRSKVMTITINGQKYILSNENKLGGGGQAEIYRLVINGKPMAYKHFFATDKINPAATLRKVGKMQEAKAQIPDELIWPLEIGYKDPQTVDGYAMELLQRNLYRTLYEWTQEDKSKYKWKLSTVIIALLKLHRLMTKLHSIGILLADVLTWHNLLFDRNGGLKLVDVDSVELQAAGIRCVAYTPAFLPPEFDPNGIRDLKAFSENSDWYGYAALVFTAIFGLPPFGGRHDDYKDDDYAARGKNKIWIFHPTTPEGQVESQFRASEPLLELFEQIFLQDKRGVFPVEILEDYLAMLIDCQGPTCFFQYPFDIDKCPSCHCPNNVDIQDEFSIKEETMPVPIMPEVLLNLESHILHAASIGNGQSILVLNNQGDQTWMHTVSDTNRTSFQILPQPLPETSEFVQVGTYTAIIQPDITDVVVIQTKTDEHNDKPYFMGTLDNCYRNEQGNLLVTGSAHRFYFVGKVRDKRYVMMGRIFTTKIKTETLNEVPDIGDIVSIAPLYFTSQDTPILVVYANGIAKIVYPAEDSYQLQLPKKPAPSSRLARVVVDTTDGAVLLRRIYHGGKEPSVVSTIIDSEGKVIFSKCEALANYPSMAAMQSGLFGKLGDKFALFHPTLDGVVLEYLESGKRSLLAATKKLVQPYCRFIWYRGELAMVNNHSIYRIPIKE